MNSSTARTRAYDNNVKRVTLKVIVETALKGYITIVQGRYPTLKYFKVGALKSLPGKRKVLLNASVKNKVLFITLIHLCGFTLIQQRGNSLVIIHLRGNA